MPAPANPQLRPWLLLAASLLACFAFWFWVDRILVPVNTVAVWAEKQPIGNNSDLYPRWLGARELLLHGRDPYSAEITRESQIGFYGRPLDPNNPADPTSQESFVYPVYAVFLLAPTVTLPFAVVQQVSRWLLLVCIAGSVPLWMRAIGCRPRWPWVISAMLLAVSCHPAVLEFHQQNLAALVFFFLAAATAVLTLNWLALAGFLLALASFKPEISGLFTLWLLFWAASRWRERQRLVWSFVGTMAALLIASQAVLPHWIREFLQSLREYPAYGGAPSVFELLLPEFFARLATIAVLLAFAVLCWRWREARPGSEWFAWNLAWVVAVTIAVLPKHAAYNQLLLIPALLVLVAHYDVVSKAGMLARALAKGAFACQVWQWMAAFALTLASTFVPAAIVRKAAFIPLYTLFALPPLTLFAVVLSSASQIKKNVAGQLTR